MGMFDWINSEASRDQKIQMLRKSQAVDASTCCIMMADADRNIVYANKAVVKLLKDNETELQKVLPHFSADNLIGENID